MRRDGDLIPFSMTVHPPPGSSADFVPDSVAVSRVRRNKTHGTQGHTSLGLGTFAALRSIWHNGQFVLIVVFHFSNSSKQKIPQQMFSVDDASHVSLQW